MHRLSDIEPDAGTGTCAVCGPGTRLRWRAHKGRWACRFADRRTQTNGADPAYQRRRNLRRFGLTEAQYDEKLAAQGGVCAICLGACTTGSRLAVDHDHETGQVRGLLCGRCNRGLGLFHDSADHLRAALEYLARHA